MKQLPQYNPEDPRFLAYLEAWQLEFASRSLVALERIEGAQAELRAAVEQIGLYKPSEAAWAEYLSYWNFPSSSVAVAVAAE
jgi:hypothetical protein